MVSPMDMPKLLQYRQIMKKVTVETFGIQYPEPQKIAQ